MDNVQDTVISNSCENEDENNEGETKSVEESKVDPWAIHLKETDDGPEWKDMAYGEQCCYILQVLMKLLFILVSLYLFICALGFLSDAFQLVGGKTAGKAFRENDVLSNPVAGLMIGVLVTVLLQSSSTTTSIIITMVGSEIIPINTAIPMVMGANIGTSVTNTIVSLAQSGDREEFRKAFGGATVHDMFNCLSVLVLLPLEIAVHYLYHLTRVIIQSLSLSESSQKKDILKVITKPFISLVVQVNKNVIKDIALNKKGAEEGTILHRWCQINYIPYNGTVHHRLSYNSTLVEKLRSKKINLTMETMISGERIMIWSSNETFTMTENIARCPNMFAQTDLPDETVGILLMFISLLLIAVSLIFMVKLLNSLLKGSIAKIVKKFINADLPGVFRYLTGYVAILIGAGTTMIIQSSSVFTSILTPLVGVGVVSIDRMFPLTVGANIGTCLTGILAALANPAKAIPNALQLALCHLFFNISGTIIFYPLPILRKVPIKLAKGLGNITSKYRWFSILYLIIMFIALPGTVFALSLSGTIPFAIVCSVLLFIIICLFAINVSRKKCPGCLPKVLRSWDFLPLCCHSLKPLDNMISKVLGIFHCCNCCNTPDKKPEVKEVKGYENSAFSSV